jgi:hypothetical protein
MVAYFEGGDKRWLDTIDFEALPSSTSSELSYSSRDAAPGAYTIVRQCDSPLEQVLSPSIYCYLCSQKADQG